MIRSQRRVHVVAWVVVPMVSVGLIAWGVTLSGPVTALDADLALDANTDQAAHAEADNTPQDDGGSE
jgi:hypothetical protein